MDTFFTKARFLKSAFTLAELPEDMGREVAFIGRSNAGKSSAINVLTHNSHLAKISKTPGRTQLINFFTLEDPNAKLIDLPGYGFAKVSDKLLRHWQQVLPVFLSKRQALQGLVLVMDCRHPLQPNDHLMLEWCEDAQVAVYALLTKADKLSRSQQLQKLAFVKDAEKTYKTLKGAQLFSAHTKEGLDELRCFLRTWLTTARDSEIS